MRARTTVPSNVLHAASAIALLLVAAACNRSRQSVASDYTPCAFGTEIRNVDAARLGACAAAAANHADHRHGSGDEQKLGLTDSAGHLSYGPYATIAPVRGFGPVTSVADVDDSSLALGVALAIVVSDSAYAPLGLEKDTNVVFITLKPGAKTGVATVVPLHNPRDTTQLQVDVQNHPIPEDKPLPAARWVFSKMDESGWVGCGDSRCCVVKAQLR